MKFTFIFALFLSVAFSCSDNRMPADKFIPNESDYLDLLNNINIIDENKKLKIHIIIEEYYNDSSLLVRINQHIFEPKESDSVQSKFLFRGMNVYVYSNRPSFYVPDSFVKQILIRASDCRLQYYNIQFEGGKIRDNSNCEIDTTKQIEIKDIL